MFTVLRSALLDGKTSSQAQCVCVCILYAGSGICLDQTFCSRKNQFMICPSEKHGIIHSQTTVVDWLEKPRDLCNLKNEPVIMQLHSTLLSLLLTLAIIGIVLMYECSKNFLSTVASTYSKVIAYPAALNVNCQAITQYDCKMSDF